MDRREAEDPAGGGVDPDERPRGVENDLRIGRDVECRFAQPRLVGILRHRILPRVPAG